MFAISLQSHSLTVSEIVPVIILSFIFLYASYSEDTFAKRRLKKYLYLRKLDDIYRPTLNTCFTFYRILNAKEKALFEKRVQKFIDIKQFIPRGGLKEITPEMKAMIAGSAIQLTFGYPDVYFRYFWRILIYPDNYYSTITKRYHKGEVNRRGIIVLSWKSFREGFMDADDGRNLGLHEMAHALRLINIVQNEEYDFYDRSVMELFDKEARDETVKLLNSPESASFFRRYSLTNTDEFFSVAVECFFERAADFRNYNPRLYSLLVQILKIDPAELYGRKEVQKIA